MSKIISFPGHTKNEIEPKKVLEDASQQELQQVLVLGWLNDNSFYLATSGGSLAEINMLIDNAKFTLLGNNLE